ncbi:trypsin-like serine peptidase [Derxia lacustris]|uniref:trypsin-like serine peptidase n=1 Tax=Derxia lacustris TaxID=764842 RepID=UPI000A1724E4|nr:trypsin-like serine protease [Derxia lacustris]
MHRPALALAALSVLFAPIARAADLPAQAGSPDAALAYWTPERFKAARPRPMPQPLRANVVTGDASATAASGGLSQAAAGHAPAPGLKPIHEPLFDARTPALRPAAETEPVTPSPQDVGSAKAPYSTRTADSSGAGDIEQYYPWSTVGKLYYSHGGQNWICSAAVIKPRIVVTAGHCLHEGDGSQGGWHSNVVFVPAYDGSNSFVTAPWGRWSAALFWVSPAWFNGGGGVPNKADLGVIELQDRALSPFGSAQRIGDVTGWLGYRTLGLTNNHTTKLGYPSNFAGGEKMIESASGWHNAAFPNNAEYGGDLGGGASGGPWIENFAVTTPAEGGALAGGANQLVGITSYKSVDGARRINGASILDSSFTALLNTACKHKARNC